MVDLVYLLDLVYLQTWFGLFIKLTV